MFFFYFSAADDRNHGTNGLLWMRCVRNLPVKRRLWKRPPTKLLLPNKASFSYIQLYENLSVVGLLSEALLQQE